MHSGFDLVIRAGRVVCPVAGFDAPGAVAVRGDRIVAMGPEVVGQTRQALEFPDAIRMTGAEGTPLLGGFGEFAAAVRADL